MATLPSIPPGDDLSAPDPQRVAELLEVFWTELDGLALELADEQWLLAAERIARLRRSVLEMMLALNGITRPATTRVLNSYLSPSQRAALEKTHSLPALDLDGLIGQAVALIVIYRWYAPQLVERYGVTYPSELEQAAWASLTTTLPAWPMRVTTD